MELLAVHYHYLGEEHQYADGIHPVSISRFESQIAHLRTAYKPVGQNELVAAIRERKPLPEKSFLITFDDSLASQYKEAVPILEKYEVPAIFFVPTLPYEENPRALLVHKIHYLLAHIPSRELLDRIVKTFQYVTGNVFDVSAVDTATIKERYRFDAFESGMCKYLFNYHFDAHITERIVSELFYAAFTGGETLFCSRLYISIGDLRALAAHELFSLGLHTHTHLNTQTAAPGIVAQDIRKNYTTLQQIIPGISIHGISYPFGLITERDYADKFKQILAEYGIAYGCTTHKGMIANFDQPHLLNRWNTNDLPFGKHPLIHF